MESNVNKSFKEGMQDTPTVKLVEAGLERIHDLPPSIVDKASRSRAEGDACKASTDTPIGATSRAAETPEPPKLQRGKYVGWDKAIISLKMFNLSAFQNCRPELGYLKCSYPLLPITVSLYFIIPVPLLVKPIALKPNSLSFGSAAAGKIPTNSYSSPP